MRHVYFQKRTISVDIVGRFEEVDFRVNAAVGVCTLECSSSQKSVVRQSSDGSSGRTIFCRLKRQIDENGLKLGMGEARLSQISFNRNEILGPPVEFRVSSLEQSI